MFVDQRRKIVGTEILLDDSVENPRIVATLILEFRGGDNSPDRRVGDDIAADGLVEPLESDQNRCSGIFELVSQFSFTAHGIDRDCDAAGFPDSGERKHELRNVLEEQSDTVSLRQTTCS